MKTFFRNNGLSLVLAALFLVCWVAQAVTGWHVNNTKLAEHGKEALSLAAYLGSGHFWQATGENWESEFLQMAAYVSFTCFLYQKGSAESKDPDKAGQEDDKGRGYSFWYRNSLSLVLLALFGLSFLIHALGGWRSANELHLAAGCNAPESFSSHLATAEFWFESFQNWQSEFLAVLAIVVLSIFLRQAGSPESKTVDSPHSSTGK